MSKGGEMLFLSDYGAKSFAETDVENSDELYNLYF
jgi:hypothetical protein